LEYLEISSISNCIVLSLPISDPIVREDREKVNNKLSPTNKIYYSIFLRQIIYYNCFLVFDDSGSTSICHKEIHEDIANKKRVHSPVCYDYSLAMIDESISKDFKILILSSIT